MGQTLKELLEERRWEENKGITFIISDTEEVVISYKELYFAASNLLYDLQEQGFVAGDEVVFQITDNQKFIYSFWACQLGGMTPVPVTTGDNDEHKRKLFKIWDILTKPRLIATSDFLKGLELFTAEHGLTGKYNQLKEKLYCYDEINPSVNTGLTYGQKVDELAFIQFSSGATGDPKGVMITHHNVFTNIAAAAKWMKMNESDVCLNWMPLTHDMGLIGTHLKSIYLNIDQYNIHTNLFIRRPQLWMKKASEHKATLLYSPNFGYKYFLKYFKDKGGLDWDLSAVRMFYNGAEPISLELCEEFLTKLAPYGLKKNTMHTVYGLAEGTIAVTFPPLNSDCKKHILKRNYLNIGERIKPTTMADAQAIVFADEGYPLENCYVKICLEDGKDIGENRVGYIHIRGGSVTGGYYNNPEESKSVIDKDGWLNTNDLGFMQDGRLTVTGRAKDIIFVNGQNFYSHDIERAAEECDGAEMGKVVAIGAFNERNNRDELVVFLLFKGTTGKFIPFIKLLKDHIFHKIGIHVDYVLPVKRIDKTTSGKVQRYKFRENYVRGVYDAIIQEIEELTQTEWENREIILPVTDTEDELLTIWKEVFERDVISTEDDFFSLGGDSLKVTQMISRIQESYPVEIGYHQLFMNSTIKSQAILLDGYKGQKAKLKNTELTKYSGKDYPLSFAQQRMWFLDKLNQGSPQYNLCQGILLDGKPNMGLLWQSLNLIAKHHDILKMTFTEESGKPIQIFHEELSIKIDKIDLTSLPEEERQEAGMEFAQGVAKTPFDLQAAPLLRAHMLKLSDETYMLILCTHHILFDGWSLGIVIKELMENYEALQKDAAFTIKRARYQYVDYTKWQTELLTQENYKKQVSYWKDNLASAYHQINLPYDKARPAVQSFRGATVCNTIMTDVVEKVKNYAKETKTTPFMVLLSVFQLLLYRYSHDKEFLLGTSSANRSRTEMEEIPGFFTNNLVLRTTIQEDSRFDTFLQETKRTLLLALENQDVPFDKLVEELKVSRDMSMNPLFQVMFTMQNTKLPEFVIDHKKGTYFSVDTGNARFDLAVDILESENGFKFLYEYNTDLFDRETIASMAANYNQTLRNVLENPHIPLDEVEILAPDEKEEVLSASRETAKEFGENTGVIGFFEGQAMENPKKIAVKCGETAITYGELNQKASRLGELLRKKGIGRDAIVGIYLERSIELLTAILGIYKAGAAYLPMDPIFPPSRLTYMIQDAKVQYIVTQETMLSALPDSDAAIIMLDAIETEAETGLGEQKPTYRDGQELAYILYTSGSTGNPKGVQIEQGALLNFLQSMKAIIDIRKQDKWLAVTTISFDISILELLLPMVSGATVVIAKREDVFDGNRLLELIKEEEITIMQATPATWKLMLEAGFPRNEALKILCGGEALPRLLADRLVEKGRILLNLYGPTETTIWSTYKAFKGQIDKITIGKPIANTSVYVLDSKLMPVPIGVPGELYIGGAGLARGYYHQDLLTEEKFIPNPFYGEKDSSKRIYKTGDIVKYLHNGELEYLQRVDNQVKIRGFRIELGEIQTILASHPFVKECVVAVKENKQNEKMIAAYIILREGIEKSQIKPEEVRSFLKEKLPEYMIPTAFVVMDAFPLTLNQKVDSKALPDPTDNKIVITKEYEEATNEIEKTLITIWKEVLHIPQAGIRDNFFDLGGYSMLLTQVRSKIADKLDREIPIIELFKYPTIESLAGFLSGAAESADRNSDQEIVDNNKISHDIAVIGMSGRFPGAKNITEFWENLCNGRESITSFTKKEAIQNGASAADAEKPEYVRAWGALGDIDKFDGKFFGYNPKEATVLDPQQRIFLEEVWKALENAGYHSDHTADVIGVYAGVGMNTYMEQLADAGYRGSLASDYQVMTSNDKDFLSTRVSYKLNLTGPSVTVQTACSSSMVALHQACLGLKNQECNMAVAGGVSIRMPEKKGYLYQEGMILSKDGHCRAFDKEAGGTVGGNGAGVVVLKRYEDAQADRDEILAVIKGSAINNDGSRKIGYTAPSVQGQTKAIQRALKESGITASQIAYIETHGTGTKMGDPIEIEALTQAFGSAGGAAQYCAIGSVKTNIGHLDAAAGITGFIKTVLSIKNRKILPSLHYKEANGEIDFANSPFYVNTKLKDYQNTEPYCAGVSSFGIGGTNAHVVLQEAPCRGETETAANANHSYLIPISAASKSVLHKKCEELKAFLTPEGQEKNINIADLAYTLSVGRKELAFRYCFIAATIAEVVAGLDIFLSDGENKLDADYLEAQEITIHEDGENTLHQIADSWKKGAGVDWNRLYEKEKPRRIPLPVYPFEQESYWPKPVKHSLKEVTALAEGGKEFTDYLYTPVWEQSTENLDRAAAKNTVLIITEAATEAQHPVAQRFIRQMKANSELLYVCRQGEDFQKIGEREYQINLHTDYDKLFGEVLKEIKGTLLIVPLFGFGSKHIQGKFDFEKDMKKGKDSFLALMGIAKAIGNKGYAGAVSMKVITNGMHKLLNEKEPKIGLACILGAVNVIPIEYPTVQCTSIDLEYDRDHETELSDSMEQLSEEILSESKAGMVAYRGQSRFVRTYKEIRLSQKQTVLPESDAREVYLITGGLGGIGLQIAEEMQNHGKPALVFLQRNAFMKETEWDSYLISPTAEDAVCKKIKVLQRLKESGMEISILQGDVSDIEDVTSVRKQILGQFGKITGIIHAAGTPGGGMIQGKQQEAVARVFAAKVQGTAVLYQAFQSDSLKNMILFSSLNAVTGGFGQSDYSGANAYMDAFAKAFDNKNGTRVITIDWERWPGIGMAKEKATAIKNVTAQHVLLGEPAAEEPGKYVFYRTFDPGHDWVLSEHHVFQIPTIAGTTYLEMARAAYEQISKAENVTIQDVVFLAPMAVPFGQKCDVITILQKRGAVYEFVVASRITESVETSWVEHVKGNISSGRTDESAETVVQGLTALQEKKYQKTFRAVDLRKQYESKFIYFGERWKSLQCLSIGEEDALAKIMLPEEFWKDLAKFKLHPALLDVATGALRFVSGGNYLPFTYQRITVKKELEAEIYAHLLFRGAMDGTPDFITCEITIYNISGEILVEIENFSMRLVENEGKLAGKENKDSTRITEQYQKVWRHLVQNEEKESNILTEGLTGEEGKKLFTHILNNCHLSEIIVSKKDLDKAISQAGYMAGLAAGKEEVFGLAEQEMHQRPELKNAYADCRSKAEETVKEIWQTLTAIEGIGIHDEFFELGGDSLLLIQLHTKLKESFGRDFPVVDLYKYNTIAKQAKLLSEAEETNQKPAFEEVNDRVTMQRSRMQQRRNLSQGNRGVKNGPL